MPTVTIDLEDEIDRWEWRCPNGHTQWEPTNHHWWCAACARSWEGDGVFHELVSVKTGEAVERDHIVLLTEVGPLEQRPTAG